MHSGTPRNSSSASRILGRREMKALSHPGANRAPKRRSTLLLPVFILAALFSAFLLHPYLSSEPEPAVPPVIPQEDPRHPAPWQALSELLARRIHDLPGAPPCLHIPLDEDRAVTLRSSLDAPYQSWVDDRLRRSMALAAVVVVMNPASGRLVALSVYNSDSARPLAFFWKTYPAASVFKVVTAAAALDGGRFAPESDFEYVGGPYTLYRKQLEARHRPGAHTASLAASFARSINPVFGKIGIHHLGKETLEAYGSAFYFNQPFPCELPLETSTLQVPEDALGIAEIASGFNRTTRVSPVQAAWIASVIASGGSAPTPWIVASVQSDPSSAVPALDHQRALVRVLPPHTTRGMQQLMEATIQYGTCRQSFSKRNRYPYLRPLTFGGKTGNINDRGDLSVKYDWFVGYAQSPDPQHALALCVLMLHGEKLGHRANAMAFDIIQAYHRQRSQTAGTLPGLPQDAEVAGGRGPSR